MPSELPAEFHGLDVEELDLGANMRISGLVHSPFFHNAIRRHGVGLKQGAQLPIFVSRLKPLDMNALANRIYEDMLVVMKNAERGMGSEGVVNPQLAAKIVSSHAPDKVIDKIGEALVEMAMTKSEIDFSSGLKTEVVAASRSGKTKLIVSGGAAFVLAATNLFVPIELGFLSEMIAWAGAGISGGYAYINKPGDRTRRIGQGNYLQRLRNQVQSAQSALSGYNFFEAPNKVAITNMLSDMEAYIDNELNPKREREKEDYEIGRASGELRRKLSTLYKFEFAKWASATQHKSLKILDEFDSVFASAQRDEEFAVFENILIEAVEITKIIRALNKKVSQALTKDITKLEKIENDDAESASYHQMVVELKKRKMGQQQFEGTLRLVMEHLRQSMMAVRTVREADMNLINSEILGALTAGNLDSVDNDNPAKLLLQSIQTLSGTLGGLNITPNAVSAGLTNVNSKNVEQAVKECINLAENAGTINGTNQVLKGCFEKLKTQMSAKQCTELASNMQTTDETDRLLLACVKDMDAGRSQLDVPQCIEMSEYARTVDGNDRILFTCFGKLKHRMTLQQCRQLSENMRAINHSKKMAKMCVGL